VCTQSIDKNVNMFARLAIVYTCRMYASSRSFAECVQDSRERVGSSREFRASRRIKSFAAGSLLRKFAACSESNRPIAVDAISPPLFRARFSYLSRDTRSRPRNLTFCSPAQPNPIWPRRWINLLARFVRWRTNRRDCFGC